jgi:hypothetical protein
MVLNLTRRRASYEHRIEKYASNGFALVLPNLKTPDREELLKLLGLSDGVPEGRHQWRRNGYVRFAECTTILLPNLRIINPGFCNKYVDTATWNSKRECYCGTCKSCLQPERSPWDGNSDITLEKFLKGCNIYKKCTSVREPNSKTEEPESDYGGMHYSSHTSVMKANFARLLKGKTTYFFYESKSGDINDTQFVCDLDAIKADLEESISGKLKHGKSGVSLRYLFHLIPTLEDWKDTVLPDLSTIMGLVEGPAPTFERKMMSVRSIISVAMVRARDTKRRLEIDGGLKLNIHWKQVDEDTTINPFIMAPMSETEWYGEWYASEESRVSEADMFGTCTEKTVDTLEITEELLDRIFDKLKPRIDAYIASKTHETSG